MSKQLYAQAAVIPYRFDENKRLEVLLVRKAGKKRWGIPKGVVDSGSTVEDAAHAEAAEEAGVVGRLSKKPVGYFSIKKWGGLCHVSVFLLRVTRVLSDYPEKETRQRQWLPLTTAAETAKRKKLRKLILELPQLLKDHAM